MAGTRRRRQQLKRQKERKRNAEAAAEAAAAAAAAVFPVHHLPPDLLREIQHRLTFLTRLAFASVISSGSGDSSASAAGHHLTPETPWLILPAETGSVAKVVSLADAGASATVRTSYSGGHVAIGSSGGWIVTADDKANLRMTNPVTGALADLPPITTVPFIEPLFGGHWFTLDVEPYLHVRFGGQPPPPPPPPPPPTTATETAEAEGETTAAAAAKHGSCGGGGADYPTAVSFTVTAEQVRQAWYRKVVLSSSPSPSPERYAAMLIFDRYIGAPAFATSEDLSWRMACCPDAVEDAIYHGGRFVSITYTGRVEEWRRDDGTGEFSAAGEIAPRVEYEHEHLRRKYLVAAADGGRLMAVLKHARVVEEVVQPERNYYSHYTRKEEHVRVFFKVLVLDGGRWEEAADDIVGDAAIFVGVNESVCVSAREHKRIRPGCVYFTDDEVGAACLRKANGKTESGCCWYGQAKDDELRDVGVYSLKNGRVDQTTVRKLAEHHLWPPPAWFRPSFL